VAGKNMPVKNEPFEVLV